MESIILAVVKKEGVIDVKNLAQKTGFKIDDVKRVLNILALKGKLTFLYDSNSKACNSLCNNCPLNTFCMLGGNKRWN